jgi:alkylhydroperoxidase/carboxymuconolactone decarboxylase family protein YurZ
LKSGRRAEKPKVTPIAPLPVPEYFGAKGMLRDRKWVESYYSIVLQWPKGCTLSTQERNLIGLAKSLAFNWEPGILNHTDLALRSGLRPEAVSEVLRTAAVIIGLAQLDKTASALPVARLRQRDQAKFATVRRYFGEVPQFLEHDVILDDPKWLEELLVVAEPAWHRGNAIISQKTRSLICLAVASVMGWKEGIGLYKKVSMGSGSTAAEVEDVVKSVFKTAVSNAMAAGFRTPCHIPSLEKYKTILSAYVESGALAKRMFDPLESQSQD